MTRSKNWQILETHFPKENYHHKETVFTIGNGYYSSRGSFEEGYHNDVATTFVHGVFNDVPVFITELVNFPCWFSLKIGVEGETFSLNTGKILDYHRQVDMSSGLLMRRVAWESPGGKQFTATFERFADMENIHHGALRFTITDFNFYGKIQIRADIPGVVSNEQYRHWQHLDQGRMTENSCFLSLETNDTHISAAIAEACNIKKGDQDLEGTYWDAHWMPTLVYEVKVQPGDKITGVKHSTIYTSREVPDPEIQAKKDLSQIAEKDFDQLLNQSQRVWGDLWERSNINIEGDDQADRALRYNLFQILTAAPRHDDKVSIGAKTLSGYGYRGHVFWDTEIFILPFLIYTQPTIARNLLMYRYHTLPGARQKAKMNGYEGAMYAWESAATGQDVTPTWVVGPLGDLIRIWCGDIEQHITADIAFGIRQYWQATKDDDFMCKYGAEIVLSAAQFYASRLEWGEDDGAYHIRDVIGPDEYHEHVDDNAMTNLMAGFCLELGLEVSAWLKDEDFSKYQSLLHESGLTEDEIRTWGSKAEKIAVNISPDGVIEQFEGYLDLIFLDQETLGPLDESLQNYYGIEGVQQYQFIKQPDVVMALYLLRDRYTQEQVRKNLDFYTPRTDLRHGSSLGPSIQALMLARMGEISRAKNLFLKTLLTDLENNRGNTPDGIHAASAGAVWQVMTFGFMGFEVENDIPVINPNLPPDWGGVYLNIIWKNRQISFDTI